MTIPVLHHDRRQGTVHDPRTYYTERHAMDGLDMAVSQCEIRVSLLLHRFLTVQDSGCVLRTLAMKAQLSEAPCDCS